MARPGATLHIGRGTKGHDDTGYILESFLKKTGVERL